MKVAEILNSLKDKLLVVKGNCDAEVDEMISHSIFYTAITRARERLKIYWTPEVENKVLSNMVPMDRKKDVGILRKFGL